MCCCMTDCTCEVGRLDTQPGSCECQTRLWPRMRMLCDCAKLTIWSAPDQLSWPRLGSTTPHFISFSGVVELNCWPAIVAYVASADRWLAASAVPILTPRPSATERSVGPAASTDWAPSPARHSAATSGTSRRARVSARQTWTTPCVMFSPSGWRPQALVVMDYYDTRRFALEKVELSAPPAGPGEHEHVVEAARERRWRRLGDGRGGRPRQAASRRDDRD